MAWSKRRLILLPLVGGVVLAVGVLATIMFRSSFQLEQLREQSVVEATLSLANEKADRLEKRIIEQDNAVRTLVRTDTLESFGRRWLAAARTQTPTVRAVLLIDLEKPSHEVVAYASRAPGPEDDLLRRVLLHRFWSEMNLEGRNPRELRHLHTEHDGQSYLISYWEQRTKGDRYLVVVYHDVPRIVHDLFPRLYSDKRQEASRVNVVDATGRILFGPPLSRGSLTLGRQFESTLYKWRVNVSIMAAEQLAAEVERRRLVEMGLVALSSLIVVFGLIVIILAANRERKLAILKSEFVANVSHELKTPLSLVRMFSEMLMTGRASKEKQRQYLEIIHQESERLSALIDNVLDFARVERGASSYEFHQANLAETVGRAVDICRPRAEAQHVELRFQVLTRGVASAAVDERAIEVGLVNLIDNALKYAKGTQVVLVELEESRSHYVISVTDQGPGISKGQRKRIFDRFVRGDHAGGERSRGSGIGLSLVFQIAEAHGGKAWVEEAQPHGARFVMTVRR